MNIYSIITVNILIGGINLIYNNVLEAIGNTPMIRLNKVCPNNCADIYVKFEALNVGGSTKTRTAYNMLKQAEKDGLINKDTIIVEPTSGNQGIGIALVGAVMGYKVKIVMPDSVSVERRKLVSQYGAEVLTVHDDGDIGKCINGCLQLALKQKEENENVYIPQQFVNPNNNLAHKNGTAAEILADFPNGVDGFCSGIGTGGTISGIGEALKAVNPNTVIWALEPENAAILSGKTVGTHIQMGIGDGLIPQNLNTHIYDDILIVTDDEAIAMSKRLAREEGLLCGISSGTNVTAAIELAKKLGKGKTVVTLLPDTGERYFSTELFD